MSNKALSLPLSIISESNLTKYIERKLPFVDKTAMVHELLLDRGPYFLARPRRFGKTLLLDTIKNIALGKKDLFANMNIMKATPKYKWRTFPVLHLDLSEVSSEPNQFEETLKISLLNQAYYHNVKVRESTPASILSQLIMKLSLRYDPYSVSPRKWMETDIRQNVVILIDEYEYPLTSIIGDNDRIEKIRSGLRDFYSVIKRYRDFYRFVFITGITNFYQMSPLSGLNNITDITFNPDYSSICGFTKSEIIKTFKKYLSDALKNLIQKKIMHPESTVDHLIKTIEDWYDGYTWDGKTKVLNPYSVVNCLANSRFDDYWFQSGTPMFIHRLGLNNNAYFNMFMKDIKIIERSKNIPLEHNASIITQNNMLNENEILLQAGYLTIDKINDETYPRIFSLKIPNTEIKNSIIDQFIQRLRVPITFSHTLDYWNDRYQNFYNSFCSLNYKKSEELFASFITSIPFYYSLSEESIFCILLFFCLNIGKHRPISEQAVIKGRADLVIKTPNNDWIIVEVKYFKPQKKEQTKNSKTVKSTKIQKSITCKTLTPASTISDSINIKNLNNIDSIPLFDPSILEVGPNKLSEKGDKILDIYIQKAFDQIKENKYAEPYLGGKEKVYAAAVAIYDSSFVRIRFKRVVWKDIISKRTIS
jgi:hypothetical protein